MLRAEEWIKKSEVGNRKSEVQKIPIYKRFLHLEIAPSVYDIASCNSSGGGREKVIHKPVF
jgi:hypothetical protein